MLYIRSPELIHLITGSLYSLINISPSLLPLVTTRLVSWKRSILLRNLQIYKTMLLFSLLFFSPFGKCNFFMRCSDYLQLCFKVYSIEIAIKLGNLLNILLQKLPLKKRQLLLLSHFSHVRLCVIPQTASHQAPLSLGFSRQEHWSGLPFPSPVHESEK